MTNLITVNNNIKGLAIFKTTLNTQTVDFVPRTDPDNPAWDAFTESTILESTKQNKVRAYKFSSLTSEVPNLLFEIVEHLEADNFEDIYVNNMKKIAERYIRSEHAMKQSNPNVAHPSPCNIFTSVQIGEDSDIVFFISKIDIAEYFDYEEIKSGLPHSHEGKRIKNWKTAKIRVCTETKEVEEIILTDTSKSIASYWAKDFLETEEITDDKKNTQTAYNAIAKIIHSIGGNNKTLQNHSDILHFRNQLNGYTINQEHFVLEEALDHIFGEYVPQDNNFSIDDIKTKVTQTFEKRQLDTSFQINAENIKNKLQTKFKISDKISLNVEHIDNLHDTITAKKINGEPTLIIKLDSEDNDVYKKFFRGEDDN